MGDGPGYSLGKKKGGTPNGHDGTINRNYKTWGGGGARFCTWF